MLIVPPRLRTEEDRGATHLELFFDLAFALVVAQLATSWTEDLTWHGAAVFAGLFTITWWSWVTTTLYANRFDTNDVLYRLAKLAVMAAVAVMAASAPEAVGTKAQTFALGYLGTRLLLLAMYARAWRHVVSARVTITIYLAGTGVGAALWTLSLVVPAPGRYWLWAVGIALEAVAPLVATRAGPEVPLHVEHLPERFGLFVLLVLGESIAAVVTGVQDTNWRADSVAVAGLGFLIAVAVWWSYFDIGAAAGNRRLLVQEKEQSLATADRYVYGHLPLMLGIAAVGVGIEQFVAHPGGGLAPTGRWALCAGAALFLTGMAAVLAGTSGSWRAAWPWPAAVVPFVVLVGVLDDLSPPASIGAVALALGLTVLAGIRAQIRGAIETPEQ